MPSGGARPNTGHRKPKAIHELQGTARKDRINENEPKYALAHTFEPPEHLDKIGREHWLYHAPIFLKAGVLSEADFSLLNAASERWSTYRHASADMRRLMNLQRPWLQKSNLATTALNSYLAIMREFGVGPASRTKVRIEKEPEKDEFSSLFED